MKKKLLIVTLIAAACAASIATLHYVTKKAEIQKQPTVTMEVATESKIKKLALSLDATADSVYGKIAHRYKDIVASLSNGTLEIEIYNNGILGYEEDLITSIEQKTNPADIMLFSVSTLIDAGCTELEPIVKPYSFKNHDDFLKWAKSKEARDLLLEPEKQGLGATGLFFCEDGFNQLFLTENTKNLQNKKIAGDVNTQSETYIKSMEAEYIYLPPIDVRESLQAGTIAGAERRLQFYVDETLWDIAPYIKMDYHLSDPCIALIKNGTAERLTAEEMNILKDAGTQTVKEFATILKKSDTDALTQAKEHGATVIK